MFKVTILANFDIKSGFEVTIYDMPVFKISFKTSQTDPWFFRLNSLFYYLFQCKIVWQIFKPVIVQWTGLVFKTLHATSVYVYVCVCVYKQTCISLCVSIYVCQCHCTSVYLCVCMYECLCMWKSVVCQISLAYIPKSAKCKNRPNGPCAPWPWRRVGGGVGVSRGRDG